MPSKPLLCCQGFRVRAKRKMAAKRQRKSRPGCVRSTRERRQICNKSRQQTAESEIPFQRNRSHRQPNRSADTQNENLLRQSCVQSPRRRFAASSSDQQKVG